MFLKKYNTSENFELKLLFISLLILPFQTFFGILILLFLTYKTWRNNYKVIINNYLSYSLIAVTILMMISSIFAHNSGEAWLGMIHFFPFFIMFLGIRTIITNYNQLFFIILPIIFNSVIIVFLGIGEVKLGWQTPDLFFKLSGWRLMAYGIPEGRMSSVFPHANPLTLYLTTALIFTVALLIYRHHKTKFNKIDLGLIFTIIINLTGLILTSSRNGWIITFISFIGFAIYVRWYLILQLLTLGGVIISWASFGNLPAQNLFRKIVPSFIWLRLSDQMYPDRPLPTLRTTQWHFCLDLITQRPFFGWGLRNFSILYEEKTATYLGHPHNLFLMISAETGLINLLLMMFIIGKILWQGIMTLISFKSSQDQGIILFSYLMVFLSFIVFNLFDVSIFDLRLNILGWIILAAISGVREKDVI
ncbi:MAG: O-antigen ligase family protein [Cyanobacteria bacterium]|nr:O-antigen ligase family protein [Cyanobacteria bacterium CG_2015-16_32_12]NCO78430.1 O-antigen ligase family protein [Cyanobacteria bacterium CG_2015-22_32_23]NCQ04817.1 O-antigen ligase family protein [Cyanobacteria bacterium CG_2015-09_32_10]NCQ42055.1 O-antigen ligase family protein [Cyanobacteria bacterium CG_2015-04_32_10]NCS84245.1 O-antigen ligase family protein [Cyanobacteria bacterium CG_2015-02_32_10]